MSNSGFLKLGRPRSLKLMASVALGRPRACSVALGLILVGPKTRTVLESALNSAPHEVMKPDFQFFEPKFFLLQVKVKKISIFGKNIFRLEDQRIFDHKNNKTKIENLASQLGAELNADSKSVLVYVLVSIDSF